MIKARKKTGDWQHFFWLTFYSSSLMSNLYISYEKKNKRTDPRIGSRWLAGKSFGWRSERNRCGEAFLTPSVTFGHVCLEGEKKQAKCFYCYSMFHILSTTNIYNYEHFQKKSGHLSSKQSERTSNNEFCLAGNSCPCPHFLPPLLVLPLFVVSYSCLGSCL